MVFQKNIAELIDYRAAYIYSNPDCNNITVGPDTNDKYLKQKICEVTHIRGKKPKSV